MTTTLRVGSATDVGQARAINQDSKLVADSVRLYAVADGVGGHKGGEVASKLAVDTIEGLVTEPTQASLIAAVEQANREIRAQSSADDDLRGMGTTLCAIAVVEADDGGEEIAWVNVGDSRIYLYRDDHLTQLSTDHNLVEELRLDGQLTDEEAAVHPQRNIITRALGIDDEVLVDSKTLTTFTGDRFLLCSDGLTNELTDDQLSATLRRLADPREAADEFVRQANEHGGRDNITCVVVDVLDDGGRTAQAVEAAAADAERAKERAAAEAEAATTQLDDDPTTESLPVVENADPVPAHDMAGFSAAAPAAATTGEPATVPAEAAGAPKPADDPLPFGRSTDDLYADLSHARGKHVTWRVVAFVLALLVVLVVAFGSIGFYAKHAYYVDFADGQVVVFQGRPGGVLMFHPSIDRRTGLKRSELTDAERQAVTKQQEFSSKADALTFVDNLTTEVHARESEATTTTTEPATTTTTRPSKAKTTTTTKPKGTAPTTTTG